MEHPFLNRVLHGLLDSSVIYPMIHSLENQWDSAIAWTDLEADAIRRGHCPHRGLLRSSLKSGSHWKGTRDTTQGWGAYLAHTGLWVRSQELKNNEISRPPCRLSGCLWKHPQMLTIPEEAHLSLQATAFPTHPNPVQAQDLFLCRDSLCRGSLLPQLSC